MDFFHLGKRGFGSFKSSEKILKIRFIFGFEMDLHAIADVFDPAGVAELFGDAVDKRPEPNALDHAEHCDVHRRAL